MKIMYNIKQSNVLYEEGKIFTYGKTYNVIADYTKRSSGQCVRDNGYVVKDNLGQDNMLFEGQIQIIDSNKDNTYIFDYE